MNKKMLESYMSSSQDEKNQQDIQEKISKSQKQLLERYKINYSRKKQECQQHLNEIQDCKIRIQTLTQQNQKLLDKISELQTKNDELNDKIAAQSLIKSKCLQKSQEKFTIKDDEKTEENKQKNQTPEGQEIKQQVITPKQQSQIYSDAIKIQNRDLREKNGILRQNQQKMKEEFDNQLCKIKECTKKISQNYQKGEIEFDDQICRAILEPLVDIIREQSKHKQKMREKYEMQKEKLQQVIRGAKNEILKSKQKMIGLQFKVTHFVQQIQEHALKLLGDQLKKYQNNETIHKKIQNMFKQLQNISIKKYQSQKQMEIKSQRNQVLIQMPVQQKSQQKLIQGIIQNISNYYHKGKSIQNQYEPILQLIKKILAQKVQEIKSDNQLQQQELKQQVLDVENNYKKNIQYIIDNLQCLNDPENQLSNNIEQFDKLCQCFQKLLIDNNKVEIQNKLFDKQKQLESVIEKLKTSQERNQSLLKDIENITKQRQTQTTKIRDLQKQAQHQNQQRKQLNYKIIQLQKKYLKAQKDLNLPQEVTLNIQDILNLVYQYIQGLQTQQKQVKAKRLIASLLRTI